MKKGLIIGGIVLGVLLFLTVIIILLVLLLLPRIKEKKIENISHLYLTYTNGYSAYAYSIYTLDCTEECILKAKQLGVPDEEIIEVEIPKEKVEEIANKLNEYHVSRWNGFSKSDKYVLDGDSFSFNLDYNDNDKISAHGYMMWPNNYSDVKSYLVNTFNEYIKEK